jgi:hypothetical protein
MAASISAHSASLSQSMTALSLGSVPEFASTPLSAGIAERKAEAKGDDKALAKGAAFQLSSITVISDVSHTKYREVAQTLHSIKEKTIGGKVAHFNEGAPSDKPENLLFSLELSEKDDPFSFQPFAELANEYGFINAQFHLPASLDAETCTYFVTKAQGYVLNVLNKFIHLASFRTFLADPAKIKDMVASYKPHELGLDPRLAPHKEAAGLQNFIDEFSNHFEMINKAMTQIPAPILEMYLKGGIVKMRTLICSNTNNSRNFLYILECLMMTKGLKLEASKLKFGKTAPEDFPMKNLFITLYQSQYGKLKDEDRAVQKKFCDDLLRTIRSQFQLKKIISKISSLQGKISKAVIFAGEGHEKILRDGLAPYSKTPITVIRTDSVQWTPAYCTSLLA